MKTFIDAVDRILTETDDEHEITDRVAGLMKSLLAGGYQLPPEYTQPGTDRHMAYPLYIAPDESFSIASVVWNVGHRTNVHSHETWGVVGIYQGAELETRYLKPTRPSPMLPAGRSRWTPGCVTVCCTTDDDVHSVVADGTEPTIGIHVYGGNLARIKRQEYDTSTGESTWFVSGWDEPATPAS